MRQRAAKTESARLEPAAAPRLEAAAPPNLARLAWGDVDRLTAKYARLWFETPADPPRLGERVPRRRQRRNARAAAALIEELAARLERYPQEESAREAWKEETRELVQSFGEHRLGWPAGYRRLLFADEFFDTTVSFARRARAFDPDIELEEMGQALRNVWIMNSLQMLLALPVELTPPVFAYSMLYPCTDNYLDDPQVPVAAKVRFNRRLGRRLEGERLEARSRREAEIFRLVGMIEARFPRRRYPEVYLSVLAIYRAQVRSLSQQRRERPPGETKLAAISSRKGGTSVLADGCLTAGRLAPDEADFCFGYGVFLQFLDDLQDARGDREAGHWTLFSRLAGTAPLDLAASRLHRFMARVLEGSIRFAAPEYDDRKDLIHRNCELLLIGALAEAPELFRPAFLRRLETRWPFTFAAMRRLRRHAQQRFREAFEKLKRRRRAGSLLELVG